MCNFHSTDIEKEPVMLTPAIQPKSCIRTEPAQCTISVQKTQCQPEISSPTTIGTNNLHTDPQPKYQSAASFHTVQNTSQDDSQTRVTNWNTLIEEKCECVNLKKKNLTLKFKTTIEKVNYLDQKLSKPISLPLNDEQTLIKSTYYMLTALACDFSKNE